MQAADETITFSELGLDNGVQYSEPFDGGNFTITFGGGGNDGKYYTTGAAIRIYGGGHFTVYSENVIEKIELTFGAGDGSNAITTDVGTYENGTWTGSSNSVVFTVGGTSGHRRLASLSVTYENIDEYQASLNEINSSMKLGYSYTYETNTETKNVDDTLNNSTTGVSGTNYTEWSKTVKSSAVYSGQSAGGNDSIQLRSKNSSSGIVTTTSGGKATNISVVWNNNTDSGKKLDVYGKNTAYNKATDLYNNTNKGTKIGDIVCGTSTELTITDDYSYIGLRSNDGALYLDSITISWTGEVTETTYSDSKFVISVGIDKKIEEIENVFEKGIYVEAGDTKEYYPVSELNTNDNYLYTTIGLGDLLKESNKSRASVPFTVKAYLIVNEGDDYKYSSQAKEFSVVGLIGEYLRRAALENSNEEYIELTDDEKDNLTLVKGLLS